MSSAAQARGADRKAGREARRRRRTFDGVVIAWQLEEDSITRLALDGGLVSRVLLSAKEGGGVDVGRGACCWKIRDMFGLRASPCLIGC